MGVILKEPRPFSFLHLMGCYNGVIDNFFNLLKI